MNKPGNEIPTRKRYKHFEQIRTRWSDNDIYGHVNNVAYYSFFDTAVNNYLITHCGLDIQAGAIIGLVVETGCQYHASISYPDELEAGVCMAKLGTSSVIYQVGIFRQGEDKAVANGRFVHVYVDRKTRKPTALSEQMRAGLTKISI